MTREEFRKAYWHARNYDIVTDLPRGYFITADGIANTHDNRVSFLHLLQYASSLRRIGDIYGARRLVEAARAYRRITRFPFP